MLLLPKQFQGNFIKTFNQYNIDKLSNDFMKKKILLINPRLASEQKSTIDNIFTLQEVIKTSKQTLGSLLIILCRLNVGCWWMWILKTLVMYAKLWHSWTLSWYFQVNVQLNPSQPTRNTSIYYLLLKIVFTFLIFSYAFRHRSCLLCLHISYLYIHWLLSCLIN